MIAFFEAALLILLVVGVVVVYRKVTASERQLGRTPAPAIGDAPFIEQARAHWLLAGRAVHALERIVEDDDIWPLVRDKDLSEARRVINDFYKREET